MARTLGVIGAGTLGPVLATVGRDLAVEVVLARRGARSDIDSEDPVLGAEILTVGDGPVDLSVLVALAREGRALRPSAEVLVSVTDKVALRRLVSAAGFPVPPWRQARDEDELRTALTTWSPVAIKADRRGYDGRGVEMFSAPLEALRRGRSMLAEGEGVLIEPVLELSAEISVTVVRDPLGNTVVYEPVRTVHFSGRCREVIAPCGLSRSIQDRASEIAVTLADHLGVLGALAVEFFVVGDEVMVNEVVARPHNTAAHSTGTYVTSHVENHLRALMGLPLGSPRRRSPVAVTVHVVGNAAGDDPADRVAEALGVDEQVRVHLFGLEHRFDRVLGAVTVWDDDVETARRRAWKTVVALRGDLTPVRPSVGRAPRE